MSWFSTNLFHFHLPGDTWKEATMHLFRPRGDKRSAFAISRREVDEKIGIDVEKLLETVALGPYEEREILHSERGDLGNFDAHDVALVARVKGSGEYYRIISVNYRGRNVSLQWAGPMAAREEVDARVKRTLANFRFTERG